MSYTLYKNTTNLSDYITSIDSVYLISRNSNYTPIAEGYNFQLSIATPTVLSSGDNIYLYSGSYLIHNGYVDKAEYDYENRKYNVYVNHRFLKLKDESVGFGNFKTYLDN